jgi:hypothetical protein
MDFTIVGDGYNVDNEYFVDHVTSNTTQEALDMVRAERGEVRLIAVFDGHHFDILAEEVTE